MSERIKGITSRYKIRLFFFIQIQPDTVGFVGKTVITISGTNFGTIPYLIRELTVTVQGGSPYVSCTHLDIVQINDTDFEPVNNL